MALGSLYVFVVLLVAAIVVGGGRPAFEQGVAPAVLRLLGAGAVLVGGMVLSAGPARREGAAMTVAAVGLAYLAATGDGGPDIGGGFLVLVLLAVLVVVGARLHRTVAADRRR